MAEATGSSSRPAFRAIIRKRLLTEMLASVKQGDSPKDWKVLILDELTVKIMSCACKMGEIVEEGISVVEDLKKRRQAMPTLDAIYFVQASDESIARIVSDMSGKSPLYKRAFVFLSSTATSELVDPMVADKTVRSRLLALKEINLEFLAVDPQGFVTDNNDALEALFAENSESSPAYETCIGNIANRLATVFASVLELPSIRYKAPKASGSEDELPSSRELAPTKLASAVWDRLQKYKTLKDFPKTETCDLIIVDRTIDLVAAFIHEWTYDALAHDLLSLDGNKYVYEVAAGAGGRTERKEVLLEEHDPIWVELRHLHIAEANIKLTDKMKQFGSKNKAAQIRLGAKEGQDLSMRDMQKLVQSLPQFREQLDKLSLHIQIATELSEKIAQQSLSDIGALEQDFTFGNSSSKELIKVFNTKQDLSAENKLRLLLIYAAVFPDKFDAAKREQWTKLAKLGEEDVKTINNLRFLGVPLVEKQAGGLFKSSKAPPPRKERPQEAGAWDLSRFYPLIEDVVEELGKGQLSKEEFPYVKEPAAAPVAAKAETSGPKVPHSVRTIRSPWATKHVNEASSSQGAPGQAKAEGRRIFVFVMGGASRIELKAVHKLTAKIKREVILGSTSLNDPHYFVEKLKSLSRYTPLEVGDIEID